DHPDAVEGAQFLHDHTAVVVEGHTQRFDHVLQTGQRTFCSRLKDQRRAGGRLRLDVVHHRHQLTAGDRPADAEAGHPVELGDAVDDDHHAGIDIFACVPVSRDRAGTVVDQLMVDVIHDQVNAPAFAEVDNIGDEGLRVDHTRGVVGAVDDD